MFKLIKFPPRVASATNTRATVELLAEALSKANTGAVSGAVIVLAGTDGSYEFAFHVGESFASLVTGTLDVQRKLLAHNED